MLRKLLNLGAIDPNESLQTKRISKLFDFLMLLVMFWLPIQWYMESRGTFPRHLIPYSDWAVWSFFFLESVVLFALVKHKKFFMQTNWLNVIIIVVVFPPLLEHGYVYFALLRYLRLLVLLRLILPQFFMLERILARNHFGATLLAFLTVTILGGVLVVYIDPSIGSPWKGIWWAWQTVTTVGYGDVIPGSIAGKVFAAVLMLVGVALFSLVSANLAAYFVERGRRQKEKKPEKMVQRQLREMGDRIETIEASAKRVEKMLEAITQGPKPPESEG